MAVIYSGSMRLSLLAAFFGVLGCGDNRLPIIQPIPDQVAQVGVELELDIRATDADGDALSFEFSAPAIPDIKTRAQKATLSGFADGVAKFRWTPQASDRMSGAYAFDFKASDGKSSTTETVQITITDGGGTAPVFRKPLGTGTTLDLEKSSTVSVDITVEDPDATEIIIGEEEPKIMGATLTATGPFEATWEWTPSTAQIMQDRYTLTLSADDMVNPKTKKSYLIVLRRKPNLNCPGTGPVIMHTAPAAQSSIQDLTIAATITDDKGVKGMPLLYHSTTMPANPPDLSAMSPVTMVRKTGTAQSGSYEGVIPNPVAASPAGTMKTVYYLVIANDDDDGSGNCHSTTAPSTGTYSVAITNPGMMQGADVCVACTSDAQCGGADDNCITVASGTFCSRACGGGLPYCPTGYHCSPSAIVSVDGKSARQCQPTVGYCGTPPMMDCMDDTLEQNDTRATAKDLAAGMQANLAYCPGFDGEGDDDYYAIQLSAATPVLRASVEMLNGVDYCDMDLQLVSTTGGTLGRSYGVGDTEKIVYCGTNKVFVRAFTFDTPPVKQNLYDLNITLGTDDAQEPANDRATAKSMSGLSLLTKGVTKTLADQVLCQGNEDWFVAFLLPNEKLTVDLVFPNWGGQDLDMVLYRENGTMLDTVMTSAGTGANEKVTVMTDNTTGSKLYYIQIKGKTATDTNGYDLKVLLE
jgi:hypothetical protein